MKEFIFRFLIFVSIFGILCLVIVLLPPTPKAKNYYLRSKFKKDSLMLNTDSRRIVFIGGSNLVFGLNSQILKDSINMNPINTGLPASIGLIYMMDNMKSKIRKGDLVVIAAEYQHFFGNFAYGGNDLTRFVFDWDKSLLFDLNKKQLTNVLKSMPSYFVSKVDYNSYLLKDEWIYGMDIFNEFGDSDYHWNLNPKTFEPTSLFTREFNSSVIDQISDFQDDLNKKGALLVISFPCFQETSYLINEKNISKVENKLKESDLLVLGSAKRFMMPDYLMFDTPYHLIREGVDRRTQLLREDINNYINSK